MRWDWTGAAITAGSSSATSVPPLEHKDGQRVRPAWTRGPVHLRTPGKSPSPPIRRTIAERMVQSAQTAAAVTLSTTVDATNLVNLRQQFKAVAIAGADDAPSIAFTDIIVKLTALALEKHPLLNARWSWRHDRGLAGTSTSASPSIPMLACWSR